MVFSSLLFIFVFIPIVYTLHYALYFFTKRQALKIRLSNIFLLVASLLFYFWGESKFVLIIVASTLIDYCAGLLMYYKPAISERSLRLVDRREEFGGAVSKRALLIISISTNIGLLFYFKYSEFSVEIYNKIANSVSASLVDPQFFSTVVLPLGISFYTFQSMSYTIDIFKGNVKPTKNFFDFALFVSFFPQLVAGPIVRYTEIEQDLRSRRVNFIGVYSGLQRFIIGLGKKALIADPLGVLVDKIHFLPEGDVTTPLAWTAAIAYTFQIYFDFSGYSDMAIGLAKMLGFNFPENFNQPYRAVSITDFWRRWHMTLSRWFRDYLYIPLGGNRKGPAFTCMNLFAVFFLCGLWHGAAVSFIAWGLYHGIFLVLERSIKYRLNFSAPRVIGSGYSFLVVVIGWVLFRADTLPQAIILLEKMFILEGGMPQIKTIWFYLSNEIIFTLFIAACISFLPVNNIGRFIYRYQQNIYYQLVKQIALIGIFVSSISYIVGNEYSPFIYFRF